MASGQSNPARGILEQLPTDKLVAGAKDLVQELVKTAGRKAMGSIGGPGGAVGKLTGAVKDTVTGGDGNGGGNGGGGGAGGGKVTNIVEEIDVGVPVRVAYDQWTRFTEFPDFMKKVEKVDQESDTELSWRAQILWSHRDWKSTITEQVPDERIVWKSEGAKGYVDGAVTFHELSPNLTKILVVLQYYPQGFFEKTGNLWRAQGRRARLELKHFRRHVMTETMLHPDDVAGWRGEIHDSEVTSSADEDNGGGEETGEEAGDGDNGGDSQAGNDTGKAAGEDNNSGKGDS